MNAKEAEKQSNKAAKEDRNIAHTALDAKGTTTGIKKRGRKRKNAAPEQEANSPAQSAKVPRTSETQAKGIEITPHPYSAPEAKVYQQKSNSTQLSL